MGKDRLYFLTFISILFVFILGASIGVNYSVKICVNVLAELELNKSKKDVQEITYLISHQVENNTDKSTLINYLQNFLYEIELETTYIVVLDKANNIICHPKITQINKETKISRRIEKAINQGLKISDIFNILMDYKVMLRKKEAITNLEILYEKPIKNTALKIASIVNFDKLLLYITKLERRLYSIFILMGVLIITISFFTVRFIGSFYEKKLEAKNSDLENDIINLARLNLRVFTKQQNIGNQEFKNIETTTQPKNNLIDNQKNRLLTYKGNDLIPTFTNDIAYIYTENTVTYVVNKEGKKSVSNASLDEIYGDLDASVFFRANRQFIIHMVAIEKVIKYGKSQLKILIINSNVDIIISKNKAAEFKRWLNI